MTYFNLAAIFWCTDIKMLRAYVMTCSGRGGLMVGVLVSRSSGPGSSRTQMHSFVLLGKTVSTLSASLHPGV